MSGTTGTTLISRIESLPPLPDVVHEIAEITNSMDATSDSVVEILEQDPTAAAMILRVANSTFCGTTRPMTQLSRAVAMLGVVAVRNFVIALHARRAWLPPGEVPEYDALWQHSIAVAAAAEIITRQKGIYPPEAAFVAGLLHDVGEMAMLDLDPDRFRTMLAQQDGTRSLLSIEAEHFGIDHAEAGHRILTHWQLPPGLTRIAAQHHDAEIEEDDELLATVVLADVCARLLGMGFDVWADHAARAEQASAVLGLNETDQLYVLDRLEPRVTEATSMLLATDAAVTPGEFQPTRSALWISTDGAGNKLGQLLLEHQGYRIIHATPEQATGDDATRDLLHIIALPEPTESTPLAARLTASGRHRLVILGPADAGAIRRTDAASGAVLIPPNFTAFDLEWAETQLASPGSVHKKAS